MLHPSTKKLIDRLNEMTLQRKIDWVQGEAAGTLAYDTEGYRVLLEGEPASLVLCDALGGELDRATIDELAATKHIDGGTYETLMESMRAEASRIARGAEDAITSVLGSLDLDGDGIPDVPEPVELEAAPDGPASEAMDEIEDNADELSAATEIGMDVVPEVEDLSLTSLDIEDTPQETVLDRAISEDEFADISDHTEAISYDLTEDNEEEVSTDFADPLTHESFEDTADIGQAVADLAEQVNNTQADALTEDTVEGISKGTASRVIGAQTFLTAFNGFPGGNAGGMIVQETTEAPAKQAESMSPAIDDKAETPGTEENLDASQNEQDLQTETLSNFEQATLNIPGPGETLSLSGLAENTSALEEIPVGSASLGPIQDAQHPVSVVHPSLEDPQAPVNETEMEAEQTFEAPPVLNADGDEAPFPLPEDEVEFEPFEEAPSHEFDQPERSSLQQDDASDAPIIEVTPESNMPVAEPEVAQIVPTPFTPDEAASQDEAGPETEEAPKTPKRFNPWI